MLGRSKSYGPSRKQQAIGRADMQTAAEHDAFLDKIVDALCQRGLRVPALIALEAGRPLTFVGGQLLWIGQPILTLFLPGPMIRQVANLLEEPDSVAALIDRLEAREA
jgi:hypothetical protein